MYFDSMKINAIGWTWVLRGLGILLLLPTLFADQFLRIFPGLEDPRISRALFYAGITLFLSGAILYYFFRRYAVRDESDLES